jgi:hypothetical protein
MSPDHTSDQFAFPDHRVPSMSGRFSSPANLAGRRTTDPDPTRLEDHESSQEPLPAALYQLHDSSREICPGPRREPKQENASRRGLIRMDQLTEVLVLGQQDPRLADRELHHNLVRGAWGNLRDRHHIVAGRTQGPHDGEVTALICQESHRQRFVRLRLRPLAGSTTTVSS